MDSAQASSRTCSFLASARLRRSFTATRETCITQVLGRTSLRRFSGEQEWSPAIAGQEARSRQEPSKPPSGLEQAFFSGWEPPVAVVHIFASTS